VTVCTYGECLAKQFDGARWFETNMLRAEIESLLHARARVVEKDQQRVVALPFKATSVRLSQDRFDLVLFQVTNRPLNGPLPRNAPHLGPRVLAQGAGLRRASSDWRGSGAEIARTIEAIDFTPDVRPNRSPSPRSASVNRRSYRAS